MVAPGENPVIKKNLIITPKRVFFSNSLGDFDGVIKVKVIELKIPAEVFDEINAKIHRADYLATTSPLQSDITEIFRSIFQSASRFAVSDKDRSWLFEQSKK